MVKVHVLYCGGWGYKSKYKKFKESLEKKISQGITLEFEYEKTKGLSGAFEVSIDGELVHSKKGGNGFVDNDTKMAAVVKAIEQKSTA